MRFANISFLFLALTFAGCKSMNGDGMSVQTVLESTAGNYDDCTRLTMHCPQADGSMKVCASTDAARVGTMSDKEDMQAMNSGETVVLEEGDALDVTVPLMGDDGKCCCVCGVTLKSNGMSREQTIERATMIAKAVQAQMSECCDDGCCSSAAGSSEGGSCCSEAGAASGSSAGGGCCSGEGEASGSSSGGGCCSGEGEASGSSCSGEGEKAAAGSCCSQGGE